MAFLSSVFGTALGSAAKVGSEAIREARQKDALSIEEFKKNVQEKKAAFAKQQAAASKKAQEINDIAKFLQNQTGYENFNSIELNDLAIKLSQMAGNKPAIQYFQENMKEGKLNLIPQINRTATMRDVGLIDGKPTKPAIEVERASSMVGEKKPTVQAQTASMLAPVKERGFLKSALVGQDPGRLQREALQQMGLTEEQYDNIFSAIPQYPMDNNTASYLLEKATPDDTVLHDRIIKKDDEIRKLLTEKNPALLSQSVKIQQAPLDQTQRGVGGSERVPAVAAFREQNPFIYLTTKMNQYLTDTDRDPKSPTYGQRLKDIPLAQEMMSSLQDTVLTQFGAAEANKGVIKTFNELYKDKKKILVDLSSTLTPNMKTTLDYTKEMKEIDELTIQRDLLLFDPNSRQEVIRLSNEIGQKITRLHSNLTPVISQEDKRKEFKSVYDIIRDLDKKERLLVRLTKTEYEDYAKLHEDYNNALKMPDPTSAMQNIFDRARSLKDALKPDPTKFIGETEKEKRFFIRNLYNDWERRNKLKLDNMSPAESAELKELALEVITNDVMADQLSTKERIIDGKAYKRRVSYIMSEDGKTPRINIDLVELDTVINGVSLKPGTGTKEFREARDNVQKYTTSLMDLGMITQQAEKDGLTFGSVGDFRVFWGSVSDNIRDIGFAFGYENVPFFKNSDKQAARAQVAKIRQLAINLISGAKNQLFKDPRLSDQDLSYVVNYIGILTRPGELKFIGQTNALTAILGLERVFLGQLAKNMYIARGKTQTNAIMAGDFRPALDLVTGEEIAGVKEINMRKNSMAANLFRTLAQTRGINIDLFINDEGRFDYAKMKKYFADPTKTFGFGPGGVALSEGPALKKFEETIDEMHNTVEYALQSANALTQYEDNSMFKQNYVTPGQAMTLTDDPKAKKRARDTLAALANQTDDMDLAEGATELLKRVDAGEINLQGGNWERAPLPIVNQGIKAIGGLIGQ
jgi:hypothetical protein